MIWSASFKKRKSSRANYIVATGERLTYYMYGRLACGRKMHDREREKPKTMTGRWKNDISYIKM